MANTQIVKVKVESLTQFGYKANGKFVNYSKQLSETDKAVVVPGAEFEAEYYVADSGKEYLNKVLKGIVTAPKTVKEPEVKPEAKPDVERARKFTPKFEKKESATMSKDEWKAKDRSQLIGGLSHDAASLAGVILNSTAVVAQDEGVVEGALRIYKQVLEGMLRIRDEVK